MLDSGLYLIVSLLIGKISYEMALFSLHNNCVHRRGLL